ncbi:MAG TPA: nitroreductase family protein, partial [Rheinheimera sp.]|uniref:nitroreductase family protein n=1 Tax=Rheinheimera sp. TaxID=1869214 RepID=UPI002F953FBE
MSKITDLLNWRYAAKKLQADKAVPQEKLEHILEAIRLSASSSGLQPYQVLVVTDAELKAQIRPV